MSALSRRPLFLLHCSLNSAQSFKRLCTSDAATKPQYSTRTRLSVAELDAARAFVDEKLRANERHMHVGQGSLASVETNLVGSNAPCEDFQSVAKCDVSDAWLFGVFDGHGGAACSRAISRRLFDYVCAAVLPKHERHAVDSVERRIRWLHATADEPDAHDEHWQAVRRFLDAFEHGRLDAAADVLTVRRAMQLAFSALDETLSAAALPDSRGVVERAHVSTAVSGSCVLLAHVRGAHLHLANVGDSGAVLGVRAPGGGWTARQLTRDHCVDNDAEVQRIRANHPAAEADTLLRGGRLLGELLPLRAFGDVRYKWTADLQRVVLEPVYGLGVIPAGLKTPPYLTALPEVYYHQLTANDRFLILATDGLWEWLTPEKAVRLVADHQLGRQTLGPYQPVESASLEQVAKELRVRKAGQSKRPIDENAATHLIRHALGGASGARQYEKLADTLQLPSSVSRCYRDDIAVVVVHFNGQASA